MKHYTLKEKTGLTSQEQKKLRILSKLANWFNEHKKPNTDTLFEKGFYNVKISRYDLHILLPVERHRFTQIVRTLLSEGFLIQNPTSHITKSGHIMPSNDTKYFVDIELINCALTNLRSRLNKLQ